MWLKRISLPKLIAITLIIAHLLSVVLCSCQPWQAATSAIEALQVKSCPAKVLGSQGISVYVRIEGQDDTIWSGDVTVSESDITADNSGKNYHLSMPTALGALNKASNKKQFQYYVTDTYGSLFVKSVNGEENQGINGWLYRVNYYSPSIGAAEFILGETVPPELPHREVLWCYGSGSYVPLKISLDSNEVETDEEFTAMVRVYSDDTNNWSPCEDATVYVDHHDYTTGADGTVDISIDDEGTYDIFAEKDACIRSDKVSVKVGTGESTQAQVSLSANIAPAISIEVSPTSIDFGNLAPGHTSDAHTLVIENKGGLPVKVTAEVTVQAQDLFVTGLKLDDNPWSLFDATVNVNDGREVQVKLAVPLNYAGVGQKSGTLIFWAEEAS